MNKITPLFSAASIALAASMALVACGDDSSSASPDETPVSSSEETVLSSSSNAAEEGWVSKASGSPYGSSCEELVNAPADSTETPADSTAAED